MMMTYVKKALRSLVRALKIIRNNFIFLLLSLQQVHYNIGKIRAEKGQVIIAEKFYREAIKYVDLEVTDEYYLIV